MKHARADYAHIQDSTGRIPPDEPVFLLRGQDLLAHGLVRQWACLLRTNGGDPRLVDLALAQADAMEAWAIKKLPDAAFS